MERYVLKHVSKMAIFHDYKNYNSMCNFVIAVNQWITTQLQKLQMCCVICN